VKFLHITYHFEYTEQVEEILQRHEIRDFVRYSMVASGDRDGRHYGSKVFPGSASVTQALVADEALEDVIADLKAFRNAKDAHRHVTVTVLAAERCEL
jgi:hypothetical protein